MITVQGGPIWLFVLALLVQGALMIGFLIWWASVMSRALKACSVHNRKMETGNPYLLLIPVFGLVWQFVAVHNTSQSLALEYHERGWKSDEGRPAMETGMIAASLFVIVIIIRLIIIDLNPGISFLLTLANCVSIYMHRERLVAFAERIEEENKVAPVFFNFDPMNNPYAFQQYFQGPQFPVHQQQEQQHIPQEAPAPMWDGSTTWRPPMDWTEPDLSDPRPYF